MSNPIIRRRIVAAAMLALAAAGGLLWGYGTIVGKAVLSVLRPAEEVLQPSPNVTLPATGVRTLVVEADVGALRLLPAATPHAIVAEAEGEAPQVDATAGAISYLTASGADELTVYAPAGLKLQLSMDRGSVVVSGYEGELMVKAASGPVAIEGGGGSLKVTGDSGAVSVKGFLGPVAVRTGTGHILVESTEGALALDTSAGWITIRGHRGALLAETRSGSFQIEAGEESQVSGPGGVKVQSR